MADQVFILSQSRPSQTDSGPDYRVCNEASDEIGVLGPIGPLAEVAHTQYVCDSIADFNENDFFIFIFQFDIQFRVNIYILKFPLKPLQSLQNLLLSPGRQFSASVSGRSPAHRNTT